MRPQKVTSLRGAHNFITFINIEKIIRTWVKCLKSKDQSFKAFKYFKIIIENEIRRRILRP
jgi:hypothetical protein